LLGMLIEKVTRSSYAQALRRDVLAGMGSRMVVQDAEPPPPPLAAPEFSEPGLDPDGQFLPNRTLASAAGAAGGIAADAPTLALWGYRLYGGQIATADRTAEMTTAIASIPFTIATGYGLGTVIWRDPEMTYPLVGHSGDIPGYSTMLGVDPIRQVSIAVLAVGAADAKNILVDLLHAGTDTE